GRLRFALLGVEQRDVRSRLGEILRGDPRLVPVAGPRLARELVEPGLFIRLRRVAELHRSMHQLERGEELLGSLSAMPIAIELDRALDQARGALLRRRGARGAL